MRARVEPSESPGWGRGALRLTLWGRMLAVRGEQAVVLEMKDTGRDVRILVRESECHERELEHQRSLRWG